MFQENDYQEDSVDSELQGSCPNVISLEMIRRRKKAHCIICGQTSSLRQFKGKWICSACLESIPSLFSSPCSGHGSYNLSR